MVFLAEHRVKERDLGKVRRAVNYMQKRALLSPAEETEKQSTAAGTGLLVSQHLRVERLAFEASRAVTNQEPGTWNRGERHRRLEFRVVVSTRAQIGFRPAVIEHVLALAMALQVTRHAAKQLTAVVLKKQVLGEPAGFPRR